ncbi:MAG: MotA/TolQ/ExbB proton channel family protein [Planctomycetes bacterium]|nr:MotA/TolQ/ExbB proton channel family protein [Planctomycetota bacterium]
MFYTYVQEGGPAVMWPLAGLSWLATLFILERVFYWVRYSVRRNPRLRRDAVEGRLSAGPTVSSGHDPVAVITCWLRVEPERGRLLAERLVSESRRGVYLLECIAGLSTSLGLFGTVVGVSMSFDSMAAGKADDVAHGLSVALYTTVAGLIIYLACFVAAGFFRHFSEKLEDELDEVAAIVGANRPAAANVAPGARP